MGALLQNRCQLGLALCPGVPALLSAELDPQRLCPPSASSVYNQLPTGQPLQDTVAASPLGPAWVISEPPSCGALWDSEGDNCRNGISSPLHKAAGPLMARDGRSLFFSLLLDRRYPAITSLDQREKYKAVFNDQYSEYRELFHEIHATLQKFKELDALMSKLPAHPQNKEVIILCTYQRDNMTPI